MQTEYAYIHLYPYTQNVEYITFVNIISKNIFVIQRFLWTRLSADICFVSLLLVINSK